MANWGDGYEQGYYDCLLKVNEILKQRLALMEKVKIEMKVKGIAKDAEGGPSMYAIANKCCGGVDAHSPNCRG